MTGKERLIKIIDKADTDVRIKAINEGIDSKSYISFIADRIFENGVIVFPCKIGDYIFCIGYGVLESLRVEGVHVEIMEDNLEYACVLARRTNGDREAFYFAEFGDVVFTTHEEAEAALAERWEK